MVDSRSRRGKLIEPVVSEDVGEVMEIGRDEFFEGFLLLLLFSSQGKFLRLVAGFLDLDLGFSKDPIISDGGVQGGTAKFSFGSTITGERLVKGEVFDQANGGCISGVFNEDFVVS